MASILSGSARSQLLPSPLPRRPAAPWVASPTPRFPSPSIASSAADRPQPCSSSLDGKTSAPQVRAPRSRHIDTMLTQARALAHTNDVQHAAMFLISRRKDQRTAGEWHMHARTRTHKYLYTQAPAYTLHTQPCFLSSAVKTSAPQVRGTCPHSCMPPVRAHATLAYTLTHACPACVPHLPPERPAHRRCARRGVTWPRTRAQTSTHARTRRHAHLHAEGLGRAWSAC